MPLLASIVGSFSSDEQKRVIRKSWGLTFDQIFAQGVDRAERLFFQKKVNSAKIDFAPDLNFYVYLGHRITVYIWNRVIDSEPEILEEVKKYDLAKKIVKNEWQCASCTV